MRGVLLLYMGAPDSLDSVQPFLYNLFSDEEIISLPFREQLAFVLSRLRAFQARKKYQEIGGKSPLLEITRKQARALEEKLGLPVYIGMRYWKPYIGEAAEEMEAQGIDEVVALPLFPQYSRATTGSCFKQLSPLEGKMEVKRVQSWHQEELFLEALKEKSLEGLESLGEGAEIIFSAHSMPLSLIEKGDPYRAQVEETARALEEKLGVKASLGYQSAGPGRWLQPSVEEVVEKLARQGTREVLAVPITFVSDHVETLYDIDVSLKGKARKLGVELERAPSLNDSKTFIGALEKIVRDRFRW